MWWWIAGGVVVLLVVGFFALLAWEKQNEAKVQARLKEFGKVVKGWIVFANDQLYRLNLPTNMLPAQVVFTLDPVWGQDDEFLEGLAEQIRNFETQNPDEHDERIIGQIVRTHLGYYTPLRIPHRLAGKVEAYTVTISVPCELLPPPKHKLTEPYICCRVIVDDEKASRRVVRMMAYPNDESAAPPSRQLPPAESRLPEADLRFGNETTRPRMRLSPRVACEIMECLSEVDSFSTVLQELAWSFRTRNSSPGGGCSRSAASGLQG